MKPILFSLVMLIIFCASALASDTRAKLEQELQALEQELPAILKEEVDLDTRQAYVNRVLELREKIEALEGGQGNLCWALAEGGWLVPFDPPLQNCEYYGSCEEAAQFARQKNYGFEGAGKCKTVPEPEKGPHILKLVSVTGPPPGKTKGISNLEILYQKDSVTAQFIRSQTHTFGKEETSTDIASFGFASYPQSILLGEPFSVSANMIRQQNHSNRSCKRFLSRKTFRPLTLQRKPQMLDFTVTLQIPVNFPAHRMKATSSKKMEYSVPCIPEVEHVYDPVTFDVGGNASVNLSCQPDPKGPERVSSDSLNYHYQCAISGSNVEMTQKKATLFWKLNKDGTPRKNRINKISVGVGGKGLGHYARPYESITLHYEPDTSGTLKAQDFGTVQHTVAVSNTWQDESGSEGKGDDSSEMIAREPDVENQTDILGREDDVPADSKKDPREGESSNSTAANSTSKPPTITAELSPDNPDVVQFMGEWMRQAEPPQNATEEGNFRYNQWGQLVGTSADGGKAEPKSRPESAAGHTSIEHLWAERNRLDSVDHCTLGEYVKRRIASENVESCRGRYVPLVPNLVGLHIGQFKAQLKNRGFNIRWREGAVSNEPTQVGKVEKQHPAPGTKLKTDRQVELWIYREAIKTVEVPNVVGMTFANAIAKLKKAGLKAKFGKMDPSNPFTLNPNQKILSQEAKADAKVEKGTTVVLNFAKEGSGKKRPSFSFGSLNPSKPRVPDVLTRPQYKKVRMPDVIGMTYEKAAAKLKSVGLKPIRKLGPNAPRRTLANTVKKAEYPANRMIDAGANIRITVYDKYQGKKDPDIIVKRDPVSAFGGQNPSDKPATVNQDWAGMWRIDRKYNMELHVSGNKVTGRYGTKMEKSIEGTISGNVLTGWWRHGKRYGRFQNTLRDDGNSWKGVWNMTTDKLGGWNGGWRGKRIVKKTPPRTPTPPRKAPPAPLFPGNGKGLDIKTAGSCKQLPPPPSRMRNPTCQCSEATGLYGLTPYTRCYWVDK